MNNRVQKLIIIVMIFTLISSQITYAHPSSQSGVIAWGELSGWKINENRHTNSQNLTYYFYSRDSYLTDAYKTIIRNGASKWSSYGTITESSSGTGMIHTYYSTNDFFALFYDDVSDSSGHLTYWAIKFATNKGITSTTAAHEFGHAYGLADLYEPNNFNKLMSGDAQNRIATNPTTQDVKGFKVITGQHSYHNLWASKAIPGYPSYVPAHMNYCTTCDGYKAQYEGCSPSSGVCIKCGIYH